MKLSHVVNPKDNGGEQLLITTVIEEGEIREQTISLQSYCNACSLHLCGAVLTPEFLRRLADDIETGLQSE